MDADGGSCVGGEGGKLEKKRSVGRSRLRGRPSWVLQQEGGAKRVGPLIYLAELVHS